MGKTSKLRAASAICIAIWMASAAPCFAAASGRAANEPAPAVAAADDRGPPATASARSPAVLESPSKPPILASMFWTTVLWIAAGALGAALITGVMARRTKISEFRQQWIDALRGDVAEFLGEVRLCQELATRAIPMWDNKARTKIQIQEYGPALRRARVLLTRIRLRINPVPNRNTDEDKAFLGALAMALSPVSNWEAAGGAEIELPMVKAELEARCLLKREWQATKGRILLGW